MNKIILSVLALPASNPNILSQGFPKIIVEIHDDQFYIIGKPAYGGRYRK